MGRRLREEEVMTIQVLHERGCSNREIARKLRLQESSVRYRLARLSSGAADGRADKPFLAESLHAVIAHWLEHARSRRGVNLQALHEHLVAEHGYTGSYKSVQRYVPIRSMVSCGAPGRNRTPDPSLRRRLLYPTELPGPGEKASKPAGLERRSEARHVDTPEAPA